MALPGRKWVLNHGKIWKKMNKPERGADLGVWTV